MVAVGPIILRYTCTSQLTEPRIIKGGQHFWLEEREYNCCIENDAILVLDKTPRRCGFEICLRGGHTP